MRPLRGFEALAGRAGRAVAPSDEEAATGNPVVLGHGGRVNEAASMPSQVMPCRRASWCLRPDGARAN
jgi:hypothetical protein